MNDCNNEYPPSEKLAKLFESKSIQDIISYVLIIK